MRRYGLYPCMVLALLVFGAASSTDAATAPPGGVVQPTKAHGLSVLPIAPDPFDFRFSDRVEGAGFRPGEQVRITVVGAAATPETVTAGADGEFAATVSFSWMFCGANAGATPAPAIVASGSEGTHELVKLTPVACPTLIAGNPAISSVPGPGPVPPGGTVSGTPVTTPGPEPGPLPDPKLPAPTTQPVLVTGFGFAPGEVVQITETGAPSIPPPVTETADDFGRVKANVHVSTPSPCSGIGRVWLTAVGDRGTVAAVLLGYPRPLSIPCPVTGAPGNGSVPPDNPSSPAAPASAAVAFGLHVGHQTVKPGGQQSVRITAPAGTRLVLAVRYAGGRMQSFHRQVGAAGAAVRWHVPRSRSSGQASLTLKAASLGLTLAQHFTVR